MSYILNARAAAETRELSDWPPIIKDGPERGARASVLPAMTFHRGSPMSDFGDSLSFLTVAAVGLGGWWFYDKYIKKSRPKNVGASHRRVPAKRGPIPGR